MAADAQAVFDISLKGDLKAQTRDAANALAELKIRIKDNQDEVDSYRAALKNLRGQTGDTSSAQRELKDKLDTLRTAMTTQRATANGLRDGLDKLRTASRQQSQEAKAATERAKALETTFKAAGGPVQELRERLHTLKEAFGGGNASMILFAGGLAFAAVAVVAFTATIVSGAVAFVKWAIGSADAARSLDLLQEAAAGSAKNNAAMTSQIDAISRRVPTARGELQKLYEELYTGANFSRMSGAAIQSTYEAIAQSSAAMGDTVGKQIGDIITRSKELGVVRINRLDVIGTGIDYEKDLVAPLAKSLTKVGPITADAMNKARAQLAIGGLKMDAGAQFLAEAVNKRFGAINLRQLLALDVQWRRLKETFISFTRGINLEPLLKTVQHFFAMFNEENSVGRALKQLIEYFGNGIVDATSKGGPAAEEFIEDLTIQALQLELAARQGKATFLDWFKVDGKELIDDLKTMVDVVKDLASAVKTVGSGVAAVHKFSSGLVDPVGDARARLEAKYPSPADSGGGPAVTSPAHADGGVVGKPAPGEFWASVAPGETIVPKGKTTTGGGSAGGSAGGAVSGKLTIEVVHKSDGSRSGAEMVQAMKGGSFLADFTHEIEAFAASLGLPTGPVTE